MPFTPSDKSPDDEETKKNRILIGPLTIAPAMSARLRRLSRTRSCLSFLSISQRPPVARPTHAVLCHVGLTGLRASLECSRRDKSPNTPSKKGSSGRPEVEDSEDGRI
ncbi:hypothetical protein KM043_013455 [Ampulex compressa]|nr:hypothetical protein KM043_013455 [Ampulex compressa]